ncbi:DUF3710 domain-containing protein [Nocardioides panacisoli]|uniref:DUF3710 domain-containing protein n=1 Tax=Nocardioides panacisoli TaxID=627624 RepID=A0ABP7IMD5_9ACTN
MRFRRKTDEVDETEVAESGDDVRVDDEAVETSPFEGGGPFDIEELPEDGVPRIDLGALLVAPGEGRDLRVQVDQASGQVQSVMLAGQTGALELKAYAAPRNGDLWSEIRPQIAADASKRGGTATEREGRFGTELVCEVQVARPDGAVGTQTSRVIGINGPRWLLRATLIGEPAREPDGADAWEAAITQVAVRRGAQAMPVGEALPLTLPEGARPQDGS